MKARSIGLVITAWLVSGGACASTPFAGTWIADPGSTEFSLRPLELSIANGRYKRASCSVADETAADGEEHPLSGNPFFDSMSVRIVDASSIEVAQKSRGRTTWQGSYHVASDLKSMTLEFTDDRPARTVTGTIRFEREGDPVAGAHALSGVWQARQLLDLSPSGASMTLEDIDHGLIMRAADGRNFQIRYGGGSNEPLHGYLEGAMVHVGRRRPNMLQINRTQDGTLVELVFGEVSADGQRLAFGQTDWPCQSKITLMFRRQPAS
jgi:hypothetical protein